MFARFFHPKKKKGAEEQLRLGNSLRDQGRFAEAEARYRGALALEPDFPAAHVSLGNLLNDQGRSTEAIVCFQSAIAIRPDYPDAHANLGNAFQYLGEMDKAIACYRQALALDPAYLEAHHNLGNALETECRTEEALDCFRKALALDPEFVEARWALTLSQIPAVYEGADEPALRRAAFSRELDELDRWFDSERSTKGARVVGIQQPFYLAYQEENNRELLGRYGKLCARLMQNWAAREGIPEPQKPERANERALRVGVVTQYFWDHSIWTAIVRGWFEHLDRRRVALYAFHLGAGDDAQTSVARARAAHFEEGGRGLRLWVEAIQRQQLDVIVYPNIGNDPLALKLACLRLAPVQVTTWGHPETTGLPTLDYYLSAEDMEPAGADENYTEKLIKLPHLGCFYRPLGVAVSEPDLKSLGLDSGGPLLLCPGTEFKYAPCHDRVFPEIARRLGRCRFLFFTDPSRRALSRVLQQRLRAAFAQAGMSADDFVVFLPWLPRPVFYGLMRRVDVFLDTIGFSGFNNAMQAVEVGLPIVTAEGRFLRGRLASGILKRMQLSELVASSEEEYAAIAVKLAQDAEYRARVRSRIAAQRHVLFEDPAPIAALEDFFLAAAAQANRTP
jgi:predicted O-linked N-acetylglucosamine transferase (SPINDLY family)